MGVAYCNQRDVVEEEAHSHNITIVSNKQSAAHLCEQLATGQWVWLVGVACNDISLCVCS